MSACVRLQSQPAHPAHPSAAARLPCSGNGQAHPGGLGAIQDVTQSAPLPEKLRDA